LEPDGKTITLTGAEPKNGAVVVRTGFGRDVPLRVTMIPSRHPDADMGVGFFFTANGEAGSVVSRERASRAAASGGASPFVVNDQRNYESDDLELWALRPGGETLLATGLPHADCLAPKIGHPVFWCKGGWGDGRALLKVDGVAGRVSRIAEALPKWGGAAMLAPSKLAVVSYNRVGVADRLGVVDLETRHGTWLTLPAASDSQSGTSEKSASRARTAPVQGGLATVSNPGEGQEATLTVYAVP
jgi:hypothetical protein